MLNNGPLAVLPMPSISIGDIFRVLQEGAPPTFKLLGESYHAVKLAAWCS